MQCYILARIKRKWIEHTKNSADHIKQEKVPIFLVGCFACAPVSFVLVQWVRWHKLLRWSLIVEWRNLVTDEKQHWSLMEVEPRFLQMA